MRSQSSIESFLLDVINGTRDIDPQVVNAMLARVEEGALTREENAYTHFCVYFAAYTSMVCEVLIGHHRKSGLWLFSGGHMDIGELPHEAAQREIREEWGTEILLTLLGTPQLLTITEINNPTRQACTKHYDIWYFVERDSAGVVINQLALRKEFYETRWMSVADALTLATDPSTRQAIERIQTRMNP